MVLLLGLCFANVAILEANMNWYYSEIILCASITPLPPSSDYAIFGQNGR